jgi:palmitoyltransferase
MPNGKASVVAPKLSDDNHVELEEMSHPGQDLSPEDDIMQLARMGDIQGIEKLYDTGKYDALYCDSEGITPLHVFHPECSLVQDTNSFAVGRNQ